MEFWDTAASCGIPKTAFHNPIHRLIAVSEHAWELSAAVMCKPVVDPLNSFLSSREPEFSKKAVRAHSPLNPMPDTSLCPFSTIPQPLLFLLVMILEFFKE
jgi:hypothetical protein